MIKIINPKKEKGENHLQNLDDDELLVILYVALKPYMRAPEHANWDIGKFDDISEIPIAMKNKILKAIDHGADNYRSTKRGIQQIKKLY